MKKIIWYVLVAMIFLWLSGCGSNSSQLGKHAPTVTTATAQLGNLANAEVKIYKIEDNGSKTLLYTERTSSGATLDEIGKFNAHLESLDDDTFYLYVVKGGEDYDSDDDGVKDTNATTNKGIIRAIAEGNDFKKAGDNFKVTAISELLYERVHAKLKHSFDKNSFEALLESEATKILNNGTIDTILSFDPVNDQGTIYIHYKERYAKIIQLIHEGKIPLWNLPAQLGSLDTDGWARGVALSSDGSKAYVADYDKGLEIIDVSDPANPSKLGSLDTDGWAESVALSSDGSKAYVADDYGLEVLDISLLDEE